MPDTRTIASPVIELTDESFDIKKSNQYHLSILACEKRFDFCILDINTSKYLVLQSVTSIEQLLQVLPFGKDLGWASVTCAVAHPKFTLIPAALYDDEQKGSLFGFSHSLDGNEKIHSDKLHGLDARNVFSISRELESGMRKQFNNIHFLHHSTAFTEGVLAQNKNNSGKKVFADFNSGYLTVLILAGRDLLFCNSFSYNTPEDIAYYILFVYEQLQLNTEEIHLILSGEIEKTTEEHSLLYTYIRHVKFASRPDEFKYSYKFDEVPGHKFFSLFTQYLCA